LSSGISLLGVKPEGKKLEDKKRRRRKRRSSD
jgi:hypothetical protein